MENTDGNAGTASGMESADRSGETAYLAGIFVDDPLRLAQENIARAIDQLKYGARQEAEAALVLIKDAQDLITFARSADGQGQRGSKGLDG